MSRAIAVLTAVSILATIALRAEENVAEPDDYRRDEYRAPTPRTLKGARVVDTSEAAVLWRSRPAVFIDVMPRAPRPRGLPPGTIWRDKPRLNIPGSIWLPDTGHGDLAASTMKYFRRGLEAATAGDPARTVVFYCLRDCWMSWNAARRAIGLSYTSVAWYPEGTDGWQSAGLPLEEAKPMELSAQQN